MAFFDDSITFFPGDNKRPMQKRRGEDGVKPVAALMEGGILLGSCNGSVSLFGRSFPDIVNHLFMLFPFLLCIFLVYYSLDMAVPLAAPNI